MKGKNTKRDGINGDGSWGNEKVMWRKLGKTNARRGMRRGCHLSLNTLENWQEPYQMTFCDLCSIRCSASTRGSFRHGTSLKCRLTPKNQVVVSKQQKIGKLVTIGRTNCLRDLINISWMGGQNDVEFRRGIWRTGMKCGTLRYGNEAKKGGIPGKSCDKLCAWANANKLFLVGSKHEKWRLIRRVIDWRSSVTHRVWFIRFSGSFWNFGGWKSHLTKDAEPSWIYKPKRCLFDCKSLWWGCWKGSNCFCNPSRPMFSRNIHQLSVRRSKCPRSSIRKKIRSEEWQLRFLIRFVLSVLLRSCSFWSSEIYLRAVFPFFVKYNFSFSSSFVCIFNRMVTFSSCSLLSVLVQNELFLWTHSKLSWLQHEQENRKKGPSSAATVLALSGLFVVGTTLILSGIIVLIVVSDMSTDMRIVAFRFNFDYVLSAGLWKSPSAMANDQN